MANRPRLRPALAVGAGLALTIVAVANAGVATIGASRDNTLYEDSFGSVSNGAGEYLFVGRTAAATLRRGLLAFDLAAAVPAGATITSVELRLTMSRTAGTGTEIALHPALKAWGEGSSDAYLEEGAGALSTPGDATWIHSFFDTTPWTNAGGDFGPDALTTAIIGGNGSYTWASTPAFVSLAQSWLDSPNSNLGLFLLGDEQNDTTAKRFNTRENADPESRPTLAVTFTIPSSSWAGLLLAAAAVGATTRRRRPS